MLGRTSKRPLGVHPQALGVDDGADCAAGVNDRSADSDRHRFTAAMVGAFETLRDRDPNAIRQRLGVIGVRAYEQDCHRVGRIPGDEVLSTEKLPHEDSEAGNDPVADPGAEPSIEACGLVDTENNQREAVAEPSGAITLGGERCIEVRSRPRRGQRIADRVRLAEHAADNRREKVERRAPYQLCHRTPVFRHGANPLVDSQFVERRAFHRGRGRKQLALRYRMFGQDGRQLCHETVPALGSSVCDRIRKEMNEFRGQAPAAIVIGRFRRITGRDRQCFVRDALGVVKDDIGDVLTQVATNAAMFAQGMEATQPEGVA